MTSRATPANELSRRRQEEEDRRKGPLVRPSGARITIVDSRNEQIFLDSSGITNQRSPVSHPYVGANSWLRVMPEVGSSGLSAQRGDAPFQNLIVYMQDGTVARDRILATEGGTDIYRPLQPGEFDFMSTGAAYIFGSERGTLELRGGFVHARFSNDYQEIRHRAPTHRWEILNYRAPSAQNNVRLGVVKRPPQTTGGTPTQGPVIERPVKVNNGGSTVYAKEHLLNLSSDGTPSILADVRIGHVVDDDGTEPTAGDTGNKLRYRAKLGTNTNSDFFNATVDIKGNVKIQLPQPAEDGLFVDVINGKIRVQSAKEMRFTTQDKYTVNASGEALTHSDQKITLESNDIRFGDGNAIHPAPFGDVLLQIITEFCNALQLSPLVITSSGAPSPALVSAVQAILAQLNQLNSNIVKLK